MGALKMNVRKALAAFLCACLLLSYNPALGAVEAAFADETAGGESVEAQAARMSDGGQHLSGSGVSQEGLDQTVEQSAKTESWDADKSHEMTTVVTVSTFDNTLRTACRDSFSATVQNLREGQVGETDVSYVWFEVTGGMPATGTNVDPYDATWKVFYNGELDQALTDWLTNASNGAIERKVENDVANYRLSLKKMAVADRLADGQHYTFVGSFQDSEGNGAVRRVSVYTIPFGVVDFEPTLIKGNGELEGTELEGLIQGGTELSGGKVSDPNAAKDAMENEAAKDTVEGDDGGNYVIGDVVQIGTIPVKLPGTGNLDVPPFNNDDLTLRLPIDDAYAKSDDNPNGYEPGDTITVMWAGDDTGKVVPVEATIVRGEDGKLKAEIVYPYAGDEDGDGVDDTGWPPLPGYFGIEYDTNRLPDSEQADGKAEYFSVTVVVNGNGTVSPAEKRYWRVKKGSDPASMLEQASYGFAPMSVGGKAYELGSLTLRKEGGRTYNFIEAAADASEAGRLSALRTTLTLTNAAEVFTPNSEWVLTASFFESSMTPEEAKGTHTLTVKAVKPDGSDASAWGGVYVYYYDASGEFTVAPQSGAASSVSEVMLNGAQATIVMEEAPPSDGVYYEVKGVQVRLNGAGEFEPQKLVRPFVIPPTVDDVEVNVIFDETTVGGMPTETYTAEVVVKTPDMGSVVGSGTVSYGANGPGPAIQFEGNTDDRYLDYANVYIGDRTTPERLNVNAAKNPTFTLMLPNYHANVRVEAYFNDAKSPSIELTVNVRTRYANGAEETSTVGGEVVPLNWDMTGIVRSGQKCTMLFSANNGYELSALEEKVGDALAVSRLDEVVGSVWRFVPIDDREDVSEPLRITVTATFEQKQGSAGAPGDNAGRPSRVGAYVADAGLSAADDADLSYIFQPIEGAFASDVVTEDTSLDAFKAAIAVSGYEARFGQVNGQTSLLDTVAYGGDYPLNLVGNTIGGADGKRYGIQKVLVVEYCYATDEASGVQVKKGLKWSLYHTNTPLYVLQNVTTHSDVIAYFAPIGDGSGEVGDGGFGEDSFANVSVKSTPQGMVSPYGTVPVLKGGMLPLRFTVETVAYELERATVAPSGSGARDITSELTAAGAAQANYVLSGISADTEVVATYRQKPEPEPVRYDLSANVRVKDGSTVTEVGTGTMPCSIAVGSGENFAQTNYLANGADNGISYLEGSDLRISLTRDEGYYALDDLALSWSDPDVLAYRDSVAQADGSTRNVVRFVTDENELTSKRPYRSGESLYGTSAEPQDARVEVWYVQNLLCPVTVAPVYEKLDRSDVTETDDSWTITTKVGRGFGQVLTDSPNFSGSVTKVPKRGGVSSTDPLTVSFVPAENYRIADVRVSTSTGNILQDFWSKVVGFIEHLGDPGAEDAMKAEAIANGYIKLQSVSCDYEITVDFEPIPGAVDPDSPLNEQVAVNVVYDPDKATVTPNAGLMVGKSAQQQFVVAPKAVGDEFYSVAGVKVQVGDGAATEVRAIDKSSALVRWGDPFFNVFVLDLAQLSWPSGSEDAAVTVEVLMSDAPNAGGDGGVADGTPGSDELKRVTVNVVADGVPVIGDSGIGGVVSPRGEFTLVPGSADAYAQRVYVVPSEDYEFDTIRVVRDGDADGSLSAAHDYILSVKDATKRYFEVEADAPGTEVITVYLKQKPLSERSYTIDVEANVSDANRFITPHGVLTLGNTESQSYTIDPDPGYQVASVTDVGLDENGNEVALPADENGQRGANWTRGNSTAPFNRFTIAPVKVGGKVLDRRVVVTFERKSDVDHGIPDADKTDLRVSAIGAGSEFLQFTPSENMTGVLKGTADEPMSYHYRFALSEQAVAQGYAIYWVQNNGEDWFGAADNVADLKTEGDFAFTTENMTRDVNTLVVYVGRFDGASGPGGSDPDARATVEFGCGSGGTIVDKDPGAHQSATASGELTNNAFTMAAGTPFTLLMTPAAGHVLSEVYLHNCYVLSYNWVTPADGRTAKVALEYTMMVSDESAPARVFALFAKGDENTFRPWDQTHVDDVDSYTTDSTFVVEVSPVDGVEALVEVLSDGTVMADDMLQLMNPVAPFSPHVDVKKADASAGEDAADADRYTVTFDTISKVGDPDNVRIVVGPLIKWDDYDNRNSTLYTVGSVSGLQDGFTVTEKPLSGFEPDSTLVNGGVEVDVMNPDADGDGVDGEGAETIEPEPERFYTYYEISGALADGERAEGEPRTVRIDLRKLGLDDGEFPEYANRVPEGMVKLQAQVTAGEGTITAAPVPTSSTSWFDDNVSGPWIVGEGSTVSFKVEPAEGYVLNALVYNGTDALENGSFDAETHVLTFRAATSTTVYAEFVSEDSPEALRTVTIEVEGEHGTTSPEPGEHQVEKGKPYPITFVPDDGYVPYRIWVDGVESYVAPTLSGWMMPAWWHDQTFKVEFALAGTTPSGSDYLNQAGQNLLNQAGTLLAKTGDNPWLPATALLVLAAGAAVLVGVRLMRASEASARRAKYSVKEREEEQRDARG